jgi:hypothetical protein
MKKGTKSSSALEVYREVMAENKPKLKIIPWTKFSKIKTPKVMWRINNLVPHSGIMSLVAPSSQRKTWVALEMMRAIASGEPFLNSEEFSVCQSNVLYIENESTPQIIKGRGELLGFDKAAENIFFPSIDSNVIFKNDSAIQELLTTCKEKNIKVIFFDTFSSTTNSIDSNSSDDVARHYRMLRPLVNDGISIIVIDHCRKSKSYQGRKTPDLYDVIGSQYKVGAVDVVLMIYNEHGSETIEVHPMKSRLGQERKPFRIIMEDVGTIDKHKIVMKYEGDINAQEIKFNKAKSLILEYLSKEDETMTKKELAIALKDQVGKTNIEHALVAMRNNGEVAAKKKGNTFYYSIIKEES